MQIYGGKKKKKVKTSPSLVQNIQNSVSSGVQNKLKFKEFCYQPSSKVAVTQIIKNLSAILNKQLHVFESCGASNDGNRILTGGKDDKVPN